MKRLVSTAAIIGLNVALAACSGGVANESAAPDTENLAVENNGDLTAIDSNVALDNGGGLDANIAAPVDAGSPNAANAAE